MSTHNVCFGARIRKIGIRQFCYIKVGSKGIYIAWPCFHNGILILGFSLDSNGPINLRTSYLEQKNIGKEYDMQHIEFQTLTVQKNFKAFKSTVTPC